MAPTSVDVSAKDPIVIVRCAHCGGAIEMTIAELVRALACQPQEDAQILCACCDTEVR